MMLLSELHRAAERRPFRPFRIVAADGSAHDITHPGLIVVGLGFVVIGRPEGGSLHVWSRSVRLDVAEIERVEPLPGPPAL